MLRSTLLAAAFFASCSRTQEPPALPPDAGPCVQACTNALGACPHPTASQSSCVTVCADAVAHLEGMTAECAAAQAACGTKAACK